MTSILQPIGTWDSFLYNHSGYRGEMIIKSVFAVICILIYFFVIYKAEKAVVSKTPCIEKDEENVPMYLGFGLMFASMLLIVFGCSMELIKGIALLLIFIYASASDIQMHEVKDFVSVFIFITGFIGISFFEIPCLLLSSLMIGGLMFIFAVISNNRLGGADVKITAACAFALGVYRSVSGLVVGLLLAVIFNIYLSRKTKTKGQPFPLVPYLSVGFMAAYLIGGITI